MQIAVLIPCLNEAGAIAKVVGDVRRALPEAAIYVYDNASTDATGAVAAQAGAILRHEPWRGKGNVVRRMFADVDADIYVMIDGDDSYEAGQCARLVEALLAGPHDMVVGHRQPSNADAHRRGHQAGSWFLRSILRLFFGGTFQDLFSGQRAFSRRFVKTFPNTATGFEIETELAVFCLQQRLPYLELPVPFRNRFSGSESKLRTVRDGLRILRTIGWLVKEERPLAFFGSIGLILALSSIAIALPLLPEYLATGKVPRFPTAILATGMMLLGFLNLAAGMLLGTLSQSRRELRRLLYLSIPPPGASATGISSPDRSDLSRSQARDP